MYFRLINHISRYGKILFNALGGLIRPVNVLSCLTMCFEVSIVSFANN